MPEAFDRCVREGGKVRTKTLDGGRYQHICIDKNGTVHPGYVKTKKSAGGESGMAQERKARLGHSGGY